MSVSVIIDDTLKLLSKSQKEKLKLKIKDMHIENIEQINKKEILEKIHYQGEEQYNTIDVELSTLDNNTILKIKLYIEKEKTKDFLRNKLHIMKLEKSSRDPKWVAYRNLKAKGVPNIPNPIEIKENKTESLNQLESIRKILPNGHPFIEYIELCLI